MKEKEYEYQGESSKWKRPIREFWTNREIDGMSISKSGCFHQKYSSEIEERPRTQLRGTFAVNIWKKEETLAKDQPVDRKQSDGLEAK